MGGAVQSSLKGWAPFGSKSPNASSMDSGIYLHQIITGGSSQINPEELHALYSRQLYNAEVITSERFPEDLNVFVEILQLLQSEEGSVDKHELLALVHKLNSPEKLLRTLFNLSTLKPFDVEAVNQITEARLSDFIDKILNARCLILEGMIKVIEAVHEASNDSASFPRWSHSVSFLARCNFALFSLGLLKYINNFKTANETSLLADFIVHTDMSSIMLGDFEEMMVVLMVSFGFWLEKKKLYELALMWLDSFDLNVLSTTAPVSHELRAVLSYLRGTLSVALERHEGVELLLEVSLLFPLAESKGHLRQFITNGESWDWLVFLKHSIDVAAEHGQLQFMKELCGSALLLTDKSIEPSFMDLQVSGRSSQLQCSLEISLTYFQVLLELNQPEEAFSALSLIPQLFDKPKDCLHLLIDYMLEKKEWTHLYLQLPWGQWWTEVRPVLESKQQYRLLFTLHSYREDYKSAALALYLLASTETSIEEAKFLLLFAKQTLLLCNEEDAWFINDSRVISAKDLETEIVLCEVHQFVLGRVPDCAPEIQTLQAHLFEYGAYQLALKLSKVFNQEPDEVFIELAQELAFYQSLQGPIEAEALQWVDIWLEGTECVILDPVSAIGKVIRSCLEQFQSSHLYGLVAETIVGQHGTLPDWLKADLLLIDPSKLVRILLGLGEAHEASKLVVESVNNSSRDMIDGKTNSAFITSTTYESLISAVTPLERTELEQAWQGLQETRHRLTA